MGERREADSAPLIEPTSLRAVFAELVAAALEEVRVVPSPMAIAYLVELLEGRVRAPAETPGTLAESLLRAGTESGAQRIECLRSLGDRALFVSGFFGDSLTRGAVGLSYYGEIGRSAYGDVAGVLQRALVEDSWPRLFEELADRFPDFVEVLAEVSERAAGSQPSRLLRLYERYLETGSEQDRRRLVLRGQALPPRGHRRLWQ